MGLTAKWEWQKKEKLYNGAVEISRSEEQKEKDRKKNELQASVGQSKAPIYTYLESQKETRDRME